MFDFPPGCLCPRCCVVVREEPLCLAFWAAGVCGQGLCLCRPADWAAIVFVFVVTLGGVVRACSGHGDAVHFVQVLHVVACVGVGAESVLAVGQVQMVLDVCRILLLSSCVSLLSMSLCLVPHFPVVSSVFAILLMSFGLIFFSSMLSGFNVVNIVFRFAGASLLSWFLMSASRCMSSWLARRLCSRL